MKVTLFAFRFTIARSLKIAVMINNLQVIILNIIIIEMMGYDTD